MTKDVLKYLQPNAAIPIDMETTSMLVNALKDAYAKQEQEPLAWIHIDPEKPKVRFLEWKENEQGYRGKWIKKPLYTSPPQRTEQEPVQETVPEGVMTAIRNEGLTLVKNLQGYRLMRLGKVEAQATPPAAQRTWVGLKEEDYVLVNQLCINPIQAAEFVDRLLKERNSV
jgi:hypothetical protein